MTHDFTSTGSLALKQCRFKYFMLCLAMKSFDMKGFGVFLLLVHDGTVFFFCFFFLPSWWNWLGAAIIQHVVLYQIMCTYSTPDWVERKYVKTFLWWIPVNCVLTGYLVRFVLENLRCHLITLGSILVVDDSNRYAYQCGNQCAWKNWYIWNIDYWGYYVEDKELSWLCRRTRQDAEMCIYTKARHRGKVSFTLIYNKIKNISYLQNYKYLSLGCIYAINNCPIIMHNATKIMFRFHSTVLLFKIIENILLITWLYAELSNQLSCSEWKAC